MDFVLVRMFVSTSERACGLCWCCCCCFCRCCCLDYRCSLSSFSVVNFSNLASPNIFLSFSFERNEKKETLLFLKPYSSLDYALQSGKYILFHALPLRVGQSERETNTPYHHDCCHSAFILRDFVIKYVSFVLRAAHIARILEQSKNNDDLTYKFWKRMNLHTTSLAVSSTTKLL